MKPGFAIYYSQSVRLTYAIFTIAIIINFIRIFSLLHSLAKMLYNLYNYMQCFAESGSGETPSLTIGIYIRITDAGANAMNGLVSCTRPTRANAM